MRDIFDAASPYAGKYSEWDYWLWAAGRSVSSAERVEWNRGKPPADWILLTAEVTPEGYPVPLVESLRETLSMMRDDPQAYSGRCVNTFSAYGELSPALSSRLELELAAVEAQFKPPIPRWLADNPPLSALPLSDGRVIMQGRLGSLATEVRGSTQPSCLYSAEGELLSELPAGQPWWLMTCGTYEATLAGLGSQVIPLFSSGMIFLRDPLSSEQLAVLSYDGSSLPLDSSPYDADLNLWQPIRGEKLALLYEAQQGLPRE